MRGGAGFGIIHRLLVPVWVMLMGACGGDWPGGEPPAPGPVAQVDSPAAGEAVAVVPAPAPAPMPVAGSVAGDASVVGRWHGAADQVEFFAGGRVLLRRGEFRGVGRYEFVQPGRMLISWEGALLTSRPGDYAVARADTLLTLCETERLERCIRYAPRHPGQAPPSLAGDPLAPRLAEPPRGEQAPPEARMAEAGPLLKQAYTLQQVYLAQNDRFAASMDALRAVGWQEAPLRNFRQPRVVRADGRRFCIVAEPLAADLWPVHIDEQGDLNRGPC